MKKLFLIILFQKIINIKTAETEINNLSEISFSPYSLVFDDSNFYQSMTKLFSKNNQKK